MWIGIIVIIALGAAGIISTKYMGADNHIEESVETIIEDTVEGLLNLEGSALKDKLDLSPGQQAI